ncbi:Reverse transcriptase RNA-dependent DNA polymerase [Arabidopsis thaliana x Arabidopsis arenosa]|uniref:Reverse transcriptase RNA-dependent DNA polymerase n=1 Tax=Arabidopsis thaliana x Arabidopsis arenosa TaxID=1240361 RepID=A0A8T1ZJF7_9BRAS|nr:Reverse transcriptase RNA-dependent DNA polymerase [Arabidopsis thaliana x Arabidopsis arenosa]
MAENNNNNNSETVAVTPTTLVNVNMNNVIKLNATNYLMWSRQVHAIFDGYSLAKFLDPSAAVPEPILVVNDVNTPNPAFDLWKRQDRLVYSGLIGALSASVQPLVSRALTSADVWLTLAQTYAKPSRGHIKQLKHQVKQWTKGTRTIDEYFQGLTTRFDQLALLGKVIDHEDQIEYILDGLSEDYKVIANQMEGRDIPPSLTELHEKLLNHEANLMTAAPTSTFPITANYVTNNRNNLSAPKPTTNQRGNDSRQSRPYLGKCQICGVQGHSAKHCYQLQGFTSQQGPAPPLLPTPPYPPSPWLPPANLVTATNPPLGQNPWVLDSGTTHHITSDLNNLSLHQPYNGGEKVLIGDGSGLRISHTGLASLPPCSKPLALRDVLCVPDIKKNLLSVYRICNANEVSVEFFPAHFQVKDLSSGIQLLQGRTNGELYDPVPSPPLIEHSGDSPSDSAPSPLGMSGSETTATPSHSPTTSSSAPSPPQPLSPAPPHSPVSPVSMSSTPLLNNSDSESSVYSQRHSSTGPDPSQAQQDSETQAQQAETVSTSTQAQSQTLNNAASSSSVPVNPANTHQMETHSKKGISKPNTKYTLAMSLAKAAGHEPQIPNQALKDEKWWKAMSEEYNAQLANHTWDLVPPPPPTVNVVGCKWIYTTNNNPDGSIRKFKARLVAKGYNQQPGLDYSETFSPVIKSTTIRTVLGIAVERDWPIRQLDINNVFLQDWTNMLSAKPVTSPMASSPKLTLRSGTPLSDATEYRCVVGSLQYLAFTRPDISYATNRLSQFMHSPTDEHWLAVKRVLRYLAGTPSHGIFLSRKNSPSLHAFSDSDWAGDNDDYVSTNAYIVYLGNHLIAWSSKKQKVN